MHRKLSIFIPGLLTLILFGLSFKACYVSYVKPYPFTTGTISNKSAWLTKHPTVNSETQVVVTKSNGEVDTFDWYDYNSRDREPLERQKKWINKKKIELKADVVSYPISQLEAFNQFIEKRETYAELSDTLKISDSSVLVHTQEVYYNTHYAFEMMRSDTIFYFYSNSLEEIREISEKEEVTIYYDESVQKSEKSFVRSIAAIDPFLTPWKRVGKSDWIVYFVMGLFTSLIFIVAMLKGGTER